MNSLLKLLVVAAIVGGAWHWWSARGDAASEATAATVAAGGFVDVVRPDGFPANAVVIMAPENCPSDAARRAEALFEKLKGAGVPVEKRSSFELSDAGGSDGDARAKFDATIKVANGTVPVVFIANSGAANPDVASVLAQFRRVVPQKP